MKKFKFLPPIMLLIATSTAPMAHADSGKSVTINNNSTYTMTQLFASSTYHSSDWNASTNLLTNGQSIGPGQSATVPISDGTSYCHYDFEAVMYGTSQYSYQYAINTCDGNSGQWTITN